MYVNDSESSPAVMCDIIYRAPLKSHFDLAIIQQKSCTAKSVEDHHIKFGRAVEGTYLLFI